MRAALVSPRAGFRLLAAFAVLVLPACVDPNSIGVKNYGSITGTLLDSIYKRPVVNAIVSVGALITARTDQNGGFALNGVPEGDQELNVVANGYVTPAAITVHVVKNAQTTLGTITMRAVQAPQ